MLGLQGHELFIILVVALLVIGPTRLPEYTRTLIDWLKQFRRFVDSSRGTLEQEMGVTVDDLKKYDPRQYDPRRIVREAWGDTDPQDLLPDPKNLVGSAATGAGATAAGAVAGAASARKSTRSSRSGTPSGPVRAPFDTEAT